MFDEGKDHYKLNLINDTPNYQQDQRDLGKELLALHKYLKKIRTDLTQLISNNDQKIIVTMQVIFNSAKNSNDKRTLSVKVETTNIIDDLFDSLIQKCETLSKKLRTLF